MISSDGLLDPGPDVLELDSPGMELAEKYCRILDSLITDVLLDVGDLAQRRNRCAEIMAAHAVWAAHSERGL